MIEALISLVVMSFGLMGIAGLQLSAMSLQKSAWSTHRVAEITTDMVERIRANPKAVDADYQYTTAYATAKAASPTKLNCRTTGTCLPSQVAADDLVDLLKKAQTSLPEGAMQITGTMAGGFVITAIYRDKDFVDSSGALQRPLTCDASTTGIDWRNCCPPTAAVASEAGVRCRRFTILP